MKKIFILVAAAIVASSTLAQQMPPIPVDPAVKMGKLDNGLTYFIRHNEEPKDQVNFYIAQKVGSMQEEESQRGLAHFLEHMCFNGTQNFPGNGVIQYCQRIGVQFGPDLNAYTSMDETVYNIDHVPTTTPGAIDSCLMILHDWADGLSLLDEDIDKERGVIHEEWRTRSDAQLRMMEVLFPQIYPNNRYGERFPIGLMSVVDSFPYQVLRDYYEKWYRPDLQGIIVVGDINVDEIEAKIKDIFGVIKAQENPAERVYFPVEDNKEPIIALAKDKENTMAQTFVFLKHDAVPFEAKTNLDYYIYFQAMQLASEMLNARLQEIIEKPNAPFSYAITADEHFYTAMTKNALTGVCVGDETKLTQSTTALYREILRAVRNGFTASEYDRARQEKLSQLETTYKARDKKSSEEYCHEIVRYFLENEPLPGIEQEYPLASQLLPNVPVEAVNALFKSIISDSTNLVIMSMLPDKEGVVYPTEAELRAALRAVEAEQIAPYVDQVTNEPLIKKLPKKGKVVKQEEAALGYRHLTLKNGVNVYLKQTDLNKDEILLSAISEGGMSLYDANETNNMEVAMELVEASGLGKFSQSALMKAQAGKQVSVTPTLTMYTEGLEAKSTPKDLENMFQLVYLTYTAIREDQEAFQSWQERTYAMKVNEEKEPMRAFQDSLVDNLYQHNPRVAHLKAEDVAKIDYQRCLEIARDRFGNAADFSFVITGAFNEETILPLIEQYLGGLPTCKTREQYRDVNLIMAKGEKDVVFNRAMEVPMTSIIYLQNGALPYTPKNLIATKMIADILEIVYTAEIREKESGTYFVVSTMQQEPWPTAKAFAQTFYQTNPERYEYLNSKIDSIQNDFLMNGPSQENLGKVRETMLKEHKQKLMENNYWSKQMQNYLHYQIDIVANYEDIVITMTPEDLRVIYRELCDQRNQTRVIMNGVKQ